MAGGDGKGPAGFGSQTGRGAGFCSGNDRPGYATGFRYRDGLGRGGSFSAGGGRRRGRGFFNRNMASPTQGYGCGFNYGLKHSSSEFTPQQEVDMLKGTARYLDEEIKAVNERIRELENLSASKE